jgi:hypothetical protein
MGKIANRFSKAMVTVMHSSLATPEDMKSGLKFNEWSEAFPPPEQGKGAWFSAALPYLSKPVLWTGDGFYLHLFRVPKDRLHRTMMNLTFQEARDWYYYIPRNPMKALIPEDSIWVEKKHVRITNTMGMNMGDGVIGVQCEYTGMADGEELTIPFIGSLGWLRETGADGSIFPWWRGEWREVA